jgi:hypothetical protein
MSIAEVGWAETMSHAFEVMGDSERADVSRIQTIWAPIENLSLTEQYNAAVQARAAGTAVATIRREILRWSPQQMEQAVEDDMEDLILGRSAAQTNPVGQNQQRPQQREPQTQDRQQANGQPQQTGAQQ